MSEANSIQMVKKIGAKQIMGLVSKVVEEYCGAKGTPGDGKVIDAYSIYGTIDSFKEGQSQFGTWVSFCGRLGAVNHITGEQFEGMQAFVPEPLQSVLKKGLEQHDEIEIACTVQIKRRDDVKEGYEYLVKPHRELGAADPLEKLRSKIPAIPRIEKVAPALEAPAEEKPKKK